MRSDCGTLLYWHNCYRDGYDLIAPDSFAHPAKMAPALCYRILKHLEELGLLKENDTILDPMAGTGLTAICANAMNYKAVTVELEEKFIGFQKQNKDYAERRLYRPLDWQIIQGDSRKLSELLGGNGLKAVTSPPYFDGNAQVGWQYTGNKGGQFITLLSKDGYDQTPGQIGNLKDLPLKAITSPPYQEAGDKRHFGGLKDTSDHVRLSSGRTYSKTLEVGPYNIGNLPDKPLKSVMSPPYGDINTTGRPNTYSGSHGPNSQVQIADYRNNEANIGNEQSESYLSAMQQVYTEIVKVSDVLVVVVKNPTRNKQLRRLDLDTIKILEASGWNIHCQHRALLFEEIEQGHLFDGSQRKVRGRMSFFKRLSWQKM